MNQLVALKIRPPRFDAAGAVERFQDYQLGQERLKEAQMDNQLAGMRMQETGDLMAAEGEFRKRARTGDPNADEALAAYPDMQRKVYDAFDGMSSRQYKQAKQRAARFGEAARNVLLYRDGTPEQAEAWNDELTKLADEKIIPQEQAEQLIEAGPNPLLIEQALTTEQWTKLYERRKEFATKDQRLRDKDEADIAFKREKAEGEFGFKREKEARLAKNADTDDVRIAAKDDADTAMEIEKSVAKFEEDNSFDAADLESDDPGTVAAAKKLKARSDALRTRLMKSAGIGPDGRRLKGRVTKPQATKGGTKVGQTATGANGQKIRWNGEAWEPVNAP